MKTIDLLKERFTSSRNLTVKMIESLEPEDLVVQSMEDVSPIKWHLAHTTWFYDVMVLKIHEDNYSAYNESYHMLFNSYYKTQGEHWLRCRRGILSRPTNTEIIKYRQNIDERIMNLISIKGEEVQTLIEIGINHEQQHQELVLMDTKHILGTNPLFPAWHSGDFPKSKRVEAKFISVAGGVKEIGQNYGEEFIFDNESPRHKEYIEDFYLSNKLITNGEYLEFIRSKEYNDPCLWLSDGWEQREKAPLYWIKDGVDSYQLSTPYGLRDLDLDAPVSHVNYYEADAFATWKGCRLPTEKEWEIAASELDINGQFYNFGELTPIAGNIAGEFNDMFGVLWQWTSSHYEVYPGYKRLSGPLAEYNAKFANAQRVLRGGSFGTLKEHYRISYRNFFQAEKSWAFTGIRLAKDRDEL